MACFRRGFDVPSDGGCQLTLRVTADSRYRLYLNGESIALGPAKGDRQTHYYETVEVGDRLRTGRNVLAARVLHYGVSEPWQMGEGGPIAVARSGSAAFLMEGELLDAQGKTVERLQTDERWRAIPDESYDYAPSGLTPWLGGMERIDGRRRPQGWEEIEYDDSRWESAAVVSAVGNVYGELTPWRLTARTIPPLYEREARFDAVVRTEGRASEQGGRLGGAQATVTIEPHERYAVELSSQALRSGYVRLGFSGGAGARIRILYSEGYEPEASSWETDQRLKGARDRAEGGKLVGHEDMYIVGGSGSAATPEAYEPFGFRVFRYLRLEVETGGEPLTIEDIHYRETGYPLEVAGSFACSDDELNRLWQISLHTLRLCMHETYEDCPYYEQLQYTMDTRLEMLFTYNVAADDRLARRAIHDYHSSALPSGMLQCRYPSMYPQVIPGFSLYWIFMLHEHYMRYGDLELVKRYRPTMLGLLDWFERRLTTEGLVGATPPQYWTHFDWVDEWTRGAPDCQAEGPLTLHSMMYAYALQHAAELLEASGWSDAAADCRAQRQSINEAIRRQCWVEARQYFSHHPQIEEYSQHPQVWAVLCGAIEGLPARELLRRTLADPALPVVSLPMHYELFRALEKVGLESEAFACWEEWRRFLPLQLTTLPEQAHGVPRSDCHAWSALPLAEFGGSLLGVRPAAPGCSRILIRPQPGTLTWARGEVPTRHGIVRVAWQIADGQFELRADAPVGVALEIVLPDGSRHEAMGGDVRVSCV